MAAHFPESEDSEDAKDGQAAHWAAAEMLAGRVVSDGQITPAGRVLTLEMVEAAEEFFEEVTQTTGPNWPRLVVSEQPVNLSRILPGMWGTPDARATLTPRLRYVWDFKFGHRYVDPFENWQLLCYALADDHAREDPNGTVVLKIVQPRSYHRSGTVRTWRLSVAQLEPYRQRLAQAAAAAMSPGATLTTGPACFDCSARHACPAYQAAGYEAAEVAGQPQVTELTPAALGLELRNLWRAADRIKGRITGLAAQAEALHARGVPVPFTEMQPGRASTVWTLPPAEVIATASLLGVNLAKPPAAITPRQAEAAGFAPELVAAYSKTVPGALKLAQQDTTTARHVFGQHPEGQ